TGIGRVIQRVITRSAEGAVMLCSRGPRGRDEGSSGDAEGGGRLAHRGRGWPWTRLPLDGPDVLDRLVLLPGQRHLGPVNVVLGHPLLQRGVTLLALGDGGADVGDDRL